MLNYPLYTEKTNCQDCYKCVRHCPVKAIRIIDNSASIIPDNCIYCGQCTKICPSDAKKVVNDIKWVEHLFEKGVNVIASIAPSWASDFEFSSNEMVSRLKNLGFWAVSETAIGAEIISEKTKSFINNTDEGLFISSCCPSVVELIKKYYPQQEKNLLPFASPFIAHAGFLKKYYGDDVHVVFIGPCIAKKHEAMDYPDHVDAVLTFSELETMLRRDEKSRNIISTDEKFVPHHAAKGSVYPLDGGMIAGIKNDVSNTTHMSFSGLSNIRNILRDINNEPLEGKIFLELMACEGGCINGPVSCRNETLVTKRKRILRKTDEEGRKETPASLFSVNVPSIQSKSRFLEPANFSDKQISEALESIGKISESDKLNCGGCGYERCKDFAKAILEGKAERSMCVSYMRKVAHNKASVLLQKMPYGVVIFDELLRIVECNKNFAKLLGEEANRIFSIKPGMYQADIKKLVSFHTLFKNFMNGGEEFLEKDIRDNGRLLRVSFFTIQKQKLACAIVHNLQSPETNKDEVVRRARKVIRENLATVQKVAFLLGENASSTEALLNSIVESVDNENNE